MKRTPKRLDHPAISYFIGLMVILIMLTVLGGMIYHFAFSSQGPGLLMPLVNKYNEKHTSTILKSAQLHQESEIHEHFHQFVDYQEAPEALRPVCYICHSNLPHSKNKQIRAMLNIHTEFFMCETCHLKNEAGIPIEYKWYNPLEATPQGPFFGTAYDPGTGELSMVDDHISRIAPYFRKGAALESTLHMQNAPLARDYLEVRDRLTPEQRASVTKKFHININPKGPECHTCHSSKSILDFKKLGFSPKRTTDIEHLNIVGLITKYNEFYLPDLFKQQENNRTEDQGRP
ncbi:MAG: hypothetical protein GXP53_03420 [Deltaproteobacteria bacterium]|nr:hypothetical protein [Deltaproteobacteria bacterium]